MIPDAAVLSASKALLADKMSNHSGDNAPQIMNACEVVARKVLEAAAPHIASTWHDVVSEAYVEGALSADQANMMWNKNPYRSEA